ncbi:DUF541 domain-containing protein [Acinetobacter qingfengensis]|uniref:Uncharacterized protein n=2 Tax=Acinetobacter qingfengensis TaxID=1262585 RepID=A0A1E7R578_9GAMM|nr:DUF541 domain-containing protein [Acinetobacter qingfengensis]OEY94466.1 hypothetical protein BJI46_03745 [Acinetobacter qingfengensis]
MAVMLIAGIGSFIPVSQVFAENNHRIINLQAEAIRQVENDEMQAILYSELSEKDTAALANKLNLTTNHALQLAKAYPQIKVRSGNQNTYPIYNDKQVLTGWRGRSQIVLTGQDFKQMGDLIAKLQSSMKLQGISFNVSDVQKQKVETELYVEASRAFQQRAQSLLAPWSATRYELVNLNLNISGGYSPRPMLEMAAYSMKSADVTTPQLEGGESTLRVIANGSIQLQ